MLLRLFSRFNRVFVKSEEVIVGTSFQKAKKRLQKGKKVREKQLKVEERLFEEQSIEREENINVCNSDQDREDTDFSSTNFSTSKKLSTNALRGKSKDSTKVLTDVKRQNTKNRLVEEIFSLVTLGSTKVVRCFQPSIICDSFHEMLYKKNIDWNLRNTS